MSYVLQYKYGCNIHEHLMSNIVKDVENSLKSKCHVWKERAILHEFYTSCTSYTVPTKKYLQGLRTKMLYINNNMLGGKKMIESGWIKRGGDMNFKIIIHPWIMIKGI